MSRPMYVSTIQYCHVHYVISAFRNITSSYNILLLFIFYFFTST
jgi:hypothetical protein